MKWKWICSNKSIIKFMISLAIIAVIIGFIFFQNQSVEVQKGVVDKVSELSTLLVNNNQNNIVFHLAIISVIVLLSLIIIGLPILIIYYLYEFASIGYLLASLFAYKSIKGLLFGMCFIIVNKILFLIILSYFLLNTINYTRKYLKSLKTSKKDLIINYLYKSFFVIILILINDIILYFVGNKIASIFIFLL